jgi:hypothetical protein
VYVNCCTETLCSPVLKITKHGSGLQMDYSQGYDGTLAMVECNDNHIQFVVNKISFCLIP